MANIEIYTKATCPFCHRAKALLNSKGVSFQEIAIDGDAVKREEMIKRSGRTTVPQIFIDAQHIGGCDDLYALDERGGLDPLLR
ncbi:glutaredoxin 3 [Salmonella enterica subsp. enterica serovar 13,23:y:e,n,z15]|nr:glutaredoxin 3 [Salmonella enterica subsp. enterica]EJU7762627.1 glutaredoxin 3 [Salmonella enterica subsp. enterica serovar 13,23:y:e,n,z15]EJU7764667.1 glutaredoxin 3 [Salmonella enterica subsp. enterica serovar 13,23:y:e,n,z15]